MKKFFPIRSSDSVSGAEFVKYTKQDLLISMLLIAFVFILGFCNLTRGPVLWGDDWAAYISEGIAIAENRLDEQTRLNYSLHPTQMPAEADSERLVYVWGYPLLLSLVYKLTGYETVAYSSLIYYKLPSAICFALFGAVLYLFLRRRFTAGLSAFASVLVCTAATFYETINSMYSDVVFLFAAMLTLLLYECFVDRILYSKPLKSWPLGLALGLSMWFTYEVRLNGSTIILVILFSQVLHLIRHKPRLNPATLVLHALPYLLMIVLKLVSEAILLPATENMSDVGRAGTQMLMDNIYEYIRMSKHFLDQLTAFDLGFVLAVPCVIGFLCDGFSLRNIHLSLLFIGSYVVLILLPYTQGMRYMYNVFPLIAMYLCYGIVRIASLLCRKLKANPLRIVRRAAAVLMVVISLSACADIAVADYKNLRNNRQVGKRNPLCADAVEMYNYIQNNTPEDSVIAFRRPRLLYLNTNRRTVHILVNGHSLFDADYLLVVPDEMMSRTEKELFAQHADLLEPVYSIGEFTLFRVGDPNAAEQAANPS